MKATDAALWTIVFFFFVVFLYFEANMVLIFLGCCGGLCAVLFLLTLFWKYVGLE